MKELEEKHNVVPLQHGTKLSNEEMKARINAMRERQVNPFRPEGYVYHSQEGTPIQRSSERTEVKVHHRGEEKGHPLQENPYDVSTVSAGIRLRPRTTVRRRKVPPRIGDVQHDVNYYEEGMTEEEVEENIGHAGPFHTQPAYYNAPQPTQAQKLELMEMLEALVAEGAIEDIPDTKIRSIFGSNKIQLRNYLKSLMMEVVQNSGGPGTVKNVVNELIRIGFPRDVYGYGLARVKVIKYR